MSDSFSEYSQKLRDAWIKFVTEVAKGLYIPQITKWLNEKLSRWNRRKQKMNNHHYILQGHTPVAVPLLQWAAWYETASRRVEKTAITKDIEVSTVFLSICHNFMGKGPPILFETMVFGGDMDEDMERYETWDEAVLGHNRIVERVRNTIEGKDAGHQDKS